MVGFVHERIAAFEKMSQMETVEVKQTPVVTKFVGKLISLFEHEDPAEVGKVEHNAEVVKLVDEAFRAQTTTSESSSYRTARSHFEGNSSHDDNPRIAAFRNKETQEAVTVDEEDEETRLRKSRFIFHVNAPATNISAARARAQRRRRVPRAKIYLRKGMRILEKARERRLTGFPRKEDSQNSRGKKSTVKDAERVRKIAKKDRSTFVDTQPRSENGDRKTRSLGLEAEESRRSMPLLPNLWPTRRARSESTQSSRQNKVVRKLLRRLSNRSAPSSMVEVNVPFPRDAIEPVGSIAATIRLKISLTRRSE